MTKHYRIFLMPLLAASLLAAPAPAQTNAKPAAKSADAMTQLFGDKVIAKGQGFDIKRSQLDAAMISIRSSATARGQNIPPEYLPTLEKQVLDRLVQVQMLLRKATDADRVRGKELTDKRVGEMMKRAGSPEAFARQLKALGLEQAEMRSRMAEEFTAEAVVEREMNVSVSDAEVKQYYEDHPARFEVPEAARVAHIFLVTRNPSTGEAMPDAEKEAKRKELEGLLKRARGGEDFGKLATQYSDDVDTREKGGEVPLFPRGAMPRTPEFEVAAFALSTNQVSDIVTTQYGMHLIKMLEKVPSKKIEFAKVSDDIKELLKQQEMGKRFADYSVKLKADNKVEILDEKLKNMPEPAAPVAPAAPAK